MLGAILNAPTVLSGLSDTEFNLVRERARAALHPEQAQMQKSSMKALDEVREGVAATKRVLLERCGIGQDDGQFRSVHEPEPGGSLAAAKTAIAA